MNMEVEFSEMEQPPLIKQLKGILSEYPDGGQIIKELIQNAEDAEATELKLLYDDRRVNSDIVQGKEYCRFFQGPALCLYNNAYFQEKDWKGIKMIYSSLKEEDRLKVGRFGLGFKSVFHLTDYPCILSGNRLLLIDPNQELSILNDVLKTTRFNAYKKMVLDAFLHAVSGTFGVNHEVMAHGNFPGTLFWFPLRERPSKLSSNLYNKQRVMDLFQSVKSEAKSLMIFLKSLTSISLSIRRGESEFQDFAKMEVNNNIYLGQEREKFKRRIAKLPSDYIGDPVECTLEMTIQCTDAERPDQDSVETWLVVDYFMGKNASQNFKKLMLDQDLSLSPYVSVAALVSQSDELDGHVFCFLPLPRDGTAQTGLPVHVNGFFALNQNRHHVKWSTEEQTDQEITDKSILWNKSLIAEALPLAYRLWILTAVERSSKLRNTKESVAAVHRAIPNKDRVQGKWVELLKPLFHILENHEFLFSDNQRKWVTVHNAMFEDLQQPIPYNCKQTVMKTLTPLMKNYVDLSKGLLESFSSYFSHLEILTPWMFRKFLVEDMNDNYQLMAENEKMEILQYLLSDNCCLNLLDLQLLPLASGGWATFQRSNLSVEEIFRCEPSELELFPGLEGKMLLNESNFPPNVFGHFRRMCAQGTFQLKTLRHESEVEMLLQRVTDNFLPGKAPKTLKHKHLTIRWLQKVWIYLTEEKMISICKKVPLLPKLIESSWIDPEMELIRVTGRMILRNQSDKKLEAGVCECLEALSVSIIPSLPKWIPVSDMKTMIRMPNAGSVVKLLSDIQDSHEISNLIKKFNEIDEASRHEFMQFMSYSNTPDNAVCELLKKLKIFKCRHTFNGTHKMCSVNENNQFTKLENFPIRYSQQLLDGYGPALSLLQRLGAKEVGLDELIYTTLKAIQSSKFNDKEVCHFMDYFITQSFSSIMQTQCKYSEHILSMAKNVAFLKCGQSLKKASDLFNPSEKLLKDLFKGEEMFPESMNQSKAAKEALLKLGLKGKDKITADNLLNVARILDSWSRAKLNIRQAHTKAQAFMKVLAKIPDYLETLCDGKPLKVLLSDLECIEFLAEKHPTFPTWLPWYKHEHLLCSPIKAKDISMMHLVGSISPLVGLPFPAISESFHWKSKLSNHTVLGQIRILRDNYDVRHKPEFLHFLSKIYEWLRQQTAETLELWKDENIVWAGEMFYAARYIVISKEKDDLHLKPYFYNIPEEFQQFKDMLEMLGCRQNQSVEVLMTTLEMIEKKHKIDSQADAKKDIKLALKVVERLSERRNEIPSLQIQNMLIPIETEEKNEIKMKPLAECTYTKNPEEYHQEENETTVFFVNSYISSKVASELGIKSLVQTILSDAEGLSFEEWGQEELLTTRLHTLLKDGYKDGMSVPKELLQNADDAGANHVKFLYDERENLDAMDSLLDCGMKVCQGPALWVYNDAKFKEEDFENITKLNGATKQENLRTIGKFGLGFCSVYNLTDVPSFVSGSNIVIFDPHKSHLAEALPGSSPGLKIDLKKNSHKALIRRHKDQFKPYRGVFGCDMYARDPEYDGTLFRLPFRTFEEAKISKVKDVYYSKTEVAELLEMFIFNAGNMLLFTQNLQSVEIYHLQPSASSFDERNMIFSMNRNCFKWQGDDFSSSGEGVLSRFTSKSTQISELQRVDISLEMFPPAGNILPNLKNRSLQTSTTWVVSWATGTRESAILSRNMKGAIPLTAVAAPCNDKLYSSLLLADIEQGFYKDGRLYCFLPIPVETKLPWHLHGCFEVTSDRRQLMIATEDDKVCQQSTWNDSLKSDSAVNAFIQLLHFFSHTSCASTYPYHSLWPLNASTEMHPFVQSFFRIIVKEEKVRVFKGKDRWLSFKEIVYLDPQVREKTDVGSTAYKMLTKFPARPENSIVDMSVTVFEALFTNNNEDARSIIQSKLISKEEMALVFLSNIGELYWKNHSQERDSMVLFAVNLKNEQVKNKLKETKCIPCESSKELKRPNECIHPETEISSMFHSSEGMFPKNDYNFRRPEILRQLVNLGMMDMFLPIQLLENRCKSIKKLASNCCNCAVERIGGILKYLSNNSDKEFYSKDDIARLTKISWLPVMDRPSSWKFTWYATNISKDFLFKGTSCSNCSQSTRCKRLLLGKAAQLYRKEDINYIASVSLILNEDSLPESLKHTSLWSFLGITDIKMTNNCSKVVEQLSVLASEYNRIQGRKLFRDFQKAYTNIVQYLQKALESNDNKLRDSVLKHAQDLQKKHIVLIGQNLALPKTVAFNVQEVCFPDLNQLPESEKLLAKSFYSAIGVKNRFSVYDIVNILKEKKTTRKKVLLKEDIKTIVKLLRNLVTAMEEEGHKYEFYTDFHEYIIGPDKKGHIHPTNELVMEDETFETRINMKLMHDDIPISLGKQLGMKSKRGNCFDEISYAFPCGQKEELVTRLEGLLKDYPSDESIMKELLQNSDDARAKEIHFIKDYRDHPTDQIFEGCNKQLQGPALCVYNDGFFTKRDLQGIQNLGLGSKRNDATKTGQYGLGFNAVYHLTDTPSFLSKGPGLEDGGILCILDPTCANIPVKESNPGVRFPVNKIRENFPDILSGYLEKDGFFQSGKGTMFRLPLRQEKSPISTEIMTKELMDEKLSIFTHKILNVLLFVKSVKSIKVSNITSGQLIHEYTVQVLMSKEDEMKRDNFFKKVNDIAEKNKRNLIENLFCGSFNVEYLLDIMDSNKIKEKWLVCQMFGCTDTFDDTIKNAFNDGVLDQLPIGGVAMPYSKFSVCNVTQHQMSSDEEEVNRKGRTASKHNGKFYSFLPLPANTGFPVHINGHFTLDHSRRNLWSEGPRNMWNEFLGRSVIIPSWISALKCIQKDVSFKFNDIGINSLAIMNELINLYHAYFPIVDHANHEFSDFLVKIFYTLILQKEENLFPVTWQEELGDFSLSWVPLKSSEEAFGAVFNNIHQNLNKNDVSQTESCVLERVFKQIGMKIISSPMDILKSLSELNLSPLYTTDPSFVLTFLQSFKEERNGSCIIGKMNTCISQTNYKTVAGLKAVVRYIRLGRQSPCVVEGLPILVSADGKIHTVSKENALFFSQYGSLLPASKGMFVHRELLGLFNLEFLFKLEVLMLLSIVDFLRLLQNEQLDGFRADTKVSWQKKKQGALLKPKWIFKFFCFIRENSSEHDGKKQKLLFKENLEHFRNWAFLPTYYHGSRKKQPKLLPIALSYGVYFKTGENKEISDIVDKFHLPTLDETVFSSQLPYSRLVKKSVQMTLANTGSPVVLLNCLHHHRCLVKQTCLHIEDAKRLLIYFNNAITEISKCPQSKARLRELPLFCTQQNTLIELDSYEVLVLPNTIPNEGIEEWSMGTKIILLQQIDEVSRLYEYLDLPITNSLGFYAAKLIQDIRYVPRQCWMIHICCMKKILLHEDVDNYTSHQTILWDKLKSLPFIQVGDKMKRANELYWPENAVFECMLNESEFPPRPVRNKEWVIFFKRLGMNFEVTDQMLLEYARDIETRGCRGITDIVRQQSRILTDCFISKTGCNDMKTPYKVWTDQTISSIKTIKFICPYTVSSNCTAIFNQPDSAARLIAYEGSVSMKYQNLCWSTMQMLGKEMLPENWRIRKSLGIYEVPPVQKVILHCQNVCTVLKETLEKGRVEIDFVKNQMDSFYIFFEKEIDNNPIIAKRLKDFPIVFLQPHNTIVQTRCVVVEMDYQEEIKPYLYRAPVFYGKYFDLFLKMGSRNVLDCNHSIFVLKALKAKVNDEILMPIELKVVKSAILILLKCLNIASNRNIETETLFLPNRQHRLLDSKTLTVSDNSNFERRLKDKLHLDYFVGFDDLEIAASNPAALFRKLPETLQPSYLSTNVTEQVCREEMEILEANKKAIEIELFLHSTVFIQGILRLVKHELTKQKTVFNEQLEVEQITECIRRMRVKNVLNLQTILMYKNNKVIGSEIQEVYFVEKETDDMQQTRYTFYFQDKGDAHGGVDITLKKGLIYLINKCTQYRIRDEMALPTILSNLEDPSKITEKLDELRIDPFNLPQSLRSSAFPRPGEYVQEHFHPFLEQGIYPFNEHEFNDVALELDDPGMESNDGEEREPVYIYVKILREETTLSTVSNLRRVYLVDTGNRYTSPEIIPIYRLYRFVRRAHVTGSSLVAYDSETVNSVPFDETCRRVRSMLQEAWLLSEKERRRIIKRLKMKWHPDRNSGNEMYCSRIFNYISSVILLLERGHCVSEIIDNTTGRSTPNMSESAYHDLVLNVDRRATVYRRSFQDNVDAYNTASCSGRFSHTCATRVPRPDIAEACRWMRQAKNDYRASQALFEVAEDVDGFNWICYTCHQACEKALKAAHFSKDVHNAPGRGHSLSFICNGLGVNLIEKVREMETRLADYNRMRYPDTASRPLIPSDMFKEDVAKFALEITQTIIDMVVEEYNIQ